ncbi:cohesin subunit SA-1 [Parambassis ranga]|uniref:Cohesin subunit SA n=1 Tax=Parambassis ranga TaxID=210632 RepID=A0A6P7J532_9TELE|nr:cohesin subunit SA-3 [Parambassis ranga]
MESGSSISDSIDKLDYTSDSGSDYEATMIAKKRRKQTVPVAQPPKRPRHNAALRGMSSLSNSPIPTTPDPSLQQQQQQSSQGTFRQVSPRPVNAGIQGISAKDIYDAVFSGKSAMVTVVDEWLCSYKQGREAGLLVLINFIVQSCGCKGVVSREMFDSMHNADIISTLTKEFNEDSVNYPLSTPGPQLKRVKAGLCEFARVLVRSCRNSFIYDEYLFPTLLALLTGLSDSQVRAFRHTSTLFALKLLTGLVEVGVIVYVQLQTTQRQCDMEKSKREHDRASDRLEELQATISELRENREELSSLMNSTFRGVFVHRYRDRLPEIRAVCIEELGIWMKSDPEGFLNDGCLKYIGWTLHDKQSPVRLQCVRALQGLYQEKEFIGRLELFTNRFKKRILSMVLDKDPDVAVEVVNLLLLLQQTEEGLQEEECSHIYPLVYAEHRGLASAAGTFLYNKLKSVIATAKKETDKSDNAAFLKILISFYIQSEFHEHAAYLVDSLWGAAGSELRDWETMTGFLLQEAGGLVYEEEGALIDLMMCAMRQAAQTTPPHGRTQGKKMLSVKDKNIQKQDKRLITTHFIPLLPLLLAKYSADAEKVCLLLKAPMYFELEMYSNAQWLEKHLDLLLSQVCGIVEKHTEVTVLEACALLVGSVCSDRYTFSSRARLAVSQLLDSLAEYFSTYQSDLLQGTADDDDDSYSAISALKRIAVLSSAMDPTGWKLFNSCLEMLKSKINSGLLDKELMVPALKCAAFHLMWAKVNATNSKPAEAELIRLKKDVRSFCRISQTCLSLDQAEIRDQAFEMLCDLLLLYSVNSVRSEPALQTLVHLPSDSLRSEMAAFLLDYIFSDTEEAEEDEEEGKITLLQKKRNQLAGYCKLVIYGVIDLTAATDVFKHYDKCFKDFGDIIKETVSKTKLINPILSAKTICLSLQQLYSEMLTEDRSKRNLTEIRDLAKRLAMSFGVDLHRARKPVVALHMDGIRFAFRDVQDGEEPYPNIPFLQVLSEFSFKLLPKDRAQLAELLKSECPSAALSWPAVRMYQRSLETRSTAKSREQEERDDTVSLQATPVAKRRRTTAKGSVLSSVKGLELESSSLHSLHTPVLTSTVQKQPDKAPGKSTTTESDIGSGITELGSEDEFSSGLQMRKVKATKRRQVLPTTEQQDLTSHLSLLSLIEDVSEREEPHIEDYESDSSYSLPSTRHTSLSIMDELFD